MIAIWASLLGAVIGGLLSATVTFLTLRWQQRNERERARELHAEERREWERRREEEALAEVLRILSELELAVPKLYALNSRSFRLFRRPPSGAGLAEEDRVSARAAYEGFIHGLRIHMPLVQSDDIRTRYGSIRMLIEELVDLGSGLSAEQRERWRGDVIRYIGYVRHSIKNRLRSVTLPAAVAPPVLARVDNALWTAPEGDPEDTYFTSAVFLEEGANLDGGAS